VYHETVVLRLMFICLFSRVIGVSHTEELFVVFSVEMKVQLA